MDNIKNNISDIVSVILNDYEDDRNINHVENFSQPDTEVIKDIISGLMKIIYPGFYREKTYKYYNQSSRITVLIEDVSYKLNKQIILALRQLPEHADTGFEEISETAAGIVTDFLQKIPRVREYLATDVDAFFDGDPAAFNHNEVILSYPGLYAVTVARLAHELFLLNVPLIPRIMTEYAHSKTGIDIHPGATIGKYFFIDHGTGIVIGETTIIGDHVKIYQGVTLGGLSTKGGQALKNKRRHPTIEDNVTIYAGASILGGDTVIGEGCTVGSNAFITSSLAPGTKVSIKNLEMNISGGNTVNNNDDDTDGSDINSGWFYII
ncbi:MAG: serine acetyltransferase [Lachnospiraceae bacterium]|nr:serine acetyltransferase [Lachnospiraceae bacterium]